MARGCTSWVLQSVSHKFVTQKLKQADDIGSDQPVGLWLGAGRKPWATDWFWTAAGRLCRGWGNMGAGGGSLSRALESSSICESAGWLSGQLESRTICVWAGSLPGSTGTAGPGPGTSSGGGCVSCPTAATLMCIVLMFAPTAHWGASPSCQPAATLTSGA